MRKLRIESVSGPFADAVLGASAARAMAYSVATGLFHPGISHVLDLNAWRALTGALKKAGLIGALIPLQFRRPGDTDPDEESKKLVEEEVRQVLSALEASPVPASEWLSMRELLGDELIERLLGISRTSIQRYAAGERPTPQDVAERLHLVTLVAADLSGSYNEYGIRRWFERKRSQLGGKTPVDALGKRGVWTPDDEPARQVRELAAALSGSGAT